MTSSDHLLLAIDTSGVGSGLAMAGAGRLDVASLSLRKGGYARTEDLADEAKTLMARRGCHPRDITLVAAVVGPGSYTGLRAGLAFLRGLAFADSLPAVAAGSLELLAWREARIGESVLVAAPAGAGRHLMAVYRRGEGAKGEMVEEMVAPHLVAESEYSTALGALEQPWPLIVGASAPDEFTDAGGCALRADAAGTSALARTAAQLGLARRVAGTDVLGQLTEFAIEKAARAQTIRVEDVLPIYVGQSATVPNQGRVAIFSMPDGA